ncbi:MAG: helix-turn-helix transcriptional regulator [Bacteroidota bacterium]|nr:helix-turn-helix transcriptional regulator [Bacteroidota bacterium]
MKPTVYDTKVGITIHAIRKLRGIKQYVLSNALHIDQSTISRIENGETAVTAGQLYIAAKVMGTTTFQILAIVKAELNMMESNKLTSLSELILNFVNLYKNPGVGGQKNFAEMEFENVIKLFLKQQA